MGGRRSVGRVYTPYWTWEDYISGMWKRLPTEQEEAMLTRAIRFTSDHVKYGKAMREVSKKWPMTMLNSLTNQSINRRAFLGHCACSYEFNCPEYITRSAWKHLTDRQRTLADHVAQQTIDEWIKEYTIRLANTYPNGKKGVINQGYQMSLPLN